jgi:hypothetical protein
MRRTFDDAFELAQTLAVELGDGRADALALTGTERLIYERSIELASSVRLELDAVVVDRFLEASNIAGGVDCVVEAAKFYATNRVKTPEPKPVADVVRELIENRRSNGASQLYLRDLKVRLEKRFAAAFHCPISSVTTAGLERFLDSLKVAPRSKKNFLTCIQTLFNFAKKRGYLLDSHPGVSKVAFDAKVLTRVEIFTVDAMRRLLGAARPELVPALCVGCFAGLRSEELRRLDWAHVRLERKHIEVLAQNAKMRRRQFAGKTSHEFAGENHPPLR